MTHFPILGNDGLDQDQQALWDELTLGPRGFYTGGPAARRLPDLYNAWLQFPAFGQAMLRLGADLPDEDKVFIRRARRAATHALKTGAPS